MAVEYMLTTVDNPFNPFTQFDAWFAWDTAAGYNSSGLLARTVMMSNDISDTDQVVATQQAIDQIVNENVTGMFRKVTADSFASTQVS
jgi:hypothetical protein